MLRKSLKIFKRILSISIDNLDTRINNREGERGERQTVVVRDYQINVLFVELSIASS